MLATANNRNDYVGAGNVGPFPYTFKIWAASDLRVVKRTSTGAETVLNYPADFTVTGIGKSAGGNVTLISALPAGYNIVVKRVRPATQTTDLRNQNSYFREDTEDALDKLVMLDQQQQESISRLFGVPESYPTNLSLQVKPETGKVLAWQSPTQLGNSLIDPLGIVLPGEGRTVATTSAYLLNNRVFNVRDYGAVGDGVADDTIAVKAAISALPAAGGRVRFPPGKYRFTTPVSNEIDAKKVVVLEGENPNSFEGLGADHNSMAVTFYLRDLASHWYTKSNAMNETLSIEGIYFDGANGANYATSVTCPGAINSADLLTFRIILKRCQFRNFGYAHTNVVGSRAVVDIIPIWGLIDECTFHKVPNGRHLRMAGTHSLVRSTEFNEARECYDVQVDNLVFDHCVFESVAFVGSQAGASLKHLDCWYENIGYSADITYNTGISQRNRGYTFSAGALVAAGGIITPIHQLYGSAHFERAHFNSFAAAGGHNYVPAAWFEALGQLSTAGSVLNGGSLFVSGVKQGPQALFAPTMAMHSTERGAFFTVTVEDSWGVSSGSAGSSLFNDSVVNNDYRIVNNGWGRIKSPDSTFIQLAQFRGGRLQFDIMDNGWAVAAAPGATQFPQGGQWEIGDRFVFPVPVAGGFTGVVCTTAGTAGAVWKTYGAITP